MPHGEAVADDFDASSSSPLCGCDYLVCIYFFCIRDMWSYRSQMLETRPWCVCTPCNHRDSVELFFLFSRGVWHSRPTTRNEAVGESGKGNLASFLYLL